MSPSNPRRRAVLLASAVIVSLAVTYVIRAMRPPLAGGSTSCSDGTPPPVYVSGPTPGGGAVGLSLSETGSCAVMVDGEVRCWGWGAAPTSREGAFGGVPHSVPPKGPWDAVTVSEHTRCTVRRDGHAECVSIDVSPAAANVFENTKRIVLGTSHHCLIRNDGRLSCWGRNGSGQLLDGTTTDVDLPLVAPSEVGPVVDVALGLAFTCVVLRGGRVLCRGLTSAGTIEPPSSLPTVVQLAAGANHVCARSDNGIVACWGESVHGELGQHGGALSGVVTLPLPAIEVVASGSRSCARLSNGDVWCWGDEKTNSAKGPVIVTRGALAVALSPVHGCVVMAKNDVLCWGDNAHKQVSLHLPPYPSGMGYDRCVAWSENTVSMGDPVFWPEGSSRRSADEPIGRRLGRLLP